MCKGFGALQRRIIEAGKATKTLWECGIPIPLIVAHDEPKTACGIKVNEKNGWIWRKDKKPWYEAKTFATDIYQFKNLAGLFREVRLDRESFQKTQYELILPACISMQHVRCVLWPELWNKCIKNIPRPDSLKRMMPQVPIEIAAGRNTANAGLSRAITSLVKRGLGSWTSIAIKDCPAVKSYWQHYDSTFGELWHSVLLVLDESLIHKS